MIRHFNKTDELCGKFSENSLRIMYQASKPRQQGSLKRYLISSRTRAACQQQLDRTTSGRIPSAVITKVYQPCIYETLEPKEEQSPAQASGRTVGFWTYIRGESSKGDCCRRANDCRSTPVSVKLSAQSGRHPVIASRLDNGPACGYHLPSGLRNAKTILVDTQIPCSQTDFSHRCHPSQGRNIR